MNCMTINLRFSKRKIERGHQQKGVQPKHMAIGIYKQGEFEVGDRGGGITIVL